MPIVSPGRAWKLTSSSTSRSVPGYRNETFRNSTSPRRSATGAGSAGTGMAGWASKILFSRPIDAAPRWNMFTTQPSAIIGQISSAR